MQATQVLAGFSLGAADVLRRAMGKKKIEEMQKQRDKFVKGCAATHQITASKANEVFDLLEKFAGYGFNKSHAAAYAVVAYQTAYLKANYPVEFLSAMMTNDMGDTDKVSILINEARTMRVEVLPPDVNESQVAFAPAREGTAVRFGLAAIKGVGEVAVESILRARADGGKFSSLEDLCERADSRTVSRKVLEALIKCGACDVFAETRAGLFARIDRAVARAAGVNQDKASGQGSLFDSLFGGPQPVATTASAPLPEWPESERLAAEKELLGFYVTGHPIMPYLPLLQTYALTDIAGLKQLANNTITRVGGLVTNVQQGNAKKSGKPYALVTIEDRDGSVQLLCMNENYDKYRELFVPGLALLAVAEVNKAEDKPKLFPQELMRLEEAPRRYTKQVHVRLRTDKLDGESLTGLRDLVQAHAGSCPLLLCLIRPDGVLVFIGVNDRCNVSPSLELQQAIEERFGKDAYYISADTAVPERAPRKWERKNGDE